MRQHTSDPDTMTITAKIADPEHRRAIRDAISAMEDIEAHCFAGSAGAAICTGKPSSKQPPGDRRALNAARAACSKFRAVRSLATNLHAERRKLTDTEQEQVDAHRKKIRIERIGNRLVAKATKLGIIYQPWEEG